MLGGVNMRMFKKALALFLSTVMLMSVCIAAPVSINAESATLIKGTFTIDTFDGYDPGELDYYYSDRYFRASGKETDPHLRTMSAALVFTSQGTSKTPDKTFGKILRNIGFTDIRTYDMDHTAMDSMGVILARKRINGKDVIAVALRGDEYELEMAANLIAGAEGDIKAFADAEALVESRVRAYISEYNITKAKYWVVGYSRSGAVANLFGRALNRDLSGFRTTADDIYVYAFEAAVGSAENVAYENIHNIIDLRDTVTYVYPALWSLYGCGVPDYIGDTDETITLKSLSLDDDHSQDIGEIRTVDFINDFVDFLATNISRKTYSEKLETPVSQIAEIFFSLNNKQRSAFIEYFSQVFSELMEDDRLVALFLRIVIDPYSEKSAEKVTDLIIKYMDKVAEKSGKPVSDDDYDTIKAAVSPIVSVFLPFAYEDFFASYGSSSAPLYHILTFTGNLNSLFKHHFNYNIFYELTALDSYYQERIDNILGDVDGDGFVTVADAAYIQRMTADMDIPFYVEKDICDVDGDGEVTLLDATYIQSWLAEIIYDNRIGKPIS